jgi:hypothetical protein
MKEASAPFAKDDNASNLKLLASFSLKNRKMGDEKALQPLYFFFPPFFFFPLAALATILTSKL